MDPGPGWWGEATTAQRQQNNSGSTASTQLDAIRRTCMRWREVAESGRKWGKVGGGELPEAVPIAPGPGAHGVLDRLFAKAQATDKVNFGERTHYVVVPR